MNAVGGDPIIPDENGNTLSSEDDRLKPLESGTAVHDSDEKTGNLSCGAASIRHTGVPGIPVPRQRSSLPKEVDKRLYAPS